MTNAERLIYYRDEVIISAARLELARIQGTQRDVAMWDEYVYNMQWMLHLSKEKT